VDLIFTLHFDPCGDITPAELLRGGVSPLEGDKAAHIIDNIGQTDPHGGSRYPYGSYEQSCLRFLIGKNRLDTRPDNGLSCIRFLDMSWHGLEMRLFPVNLRDKAMLFHEVLIGF
jgi:hypothetical protein